MSSATEQRSSAIDIDQLRGSFTTMYDAWADRAYGLAVAVTSSPEPAAELATAVWCNVWRRWREFVAIQGAMPDDAWLERELRCSVVVLSCCDAEVGSTHSSVFDRYLTSA